MLCAEGDDIVFHRAGSEDVFQGVFEGYCIESIPTPDQLETFFVSDDEPRNQWGLSMILTDPQYIDGAGMEHAIAEYVVVPLTYPDTHPRRVIETSQVTTNAQQERILQAMHDVTDLFHDSSTQAVFTDIENDLNYNNYRDEALQVARMEYQDSIDRTQGFTEGATVQLVCTSVLREQGGTTACMGEVVTYVRPTLIYASTIWRVAHRFSRTTNEGGEETLYALPEYIEAAYVQAEV